MLGVQVLPRHGQALLGAPQLEIIARHLGSDADLRVLIVRPFGAQVSARGLDRTAHVTEEIELPCGVKPEAVALRIDSGGAKSRLLLIEVRIPTIELHVRCVVEFSLHEYRARCPDAVVRGTQVQIGRECTAHEIVEFGVSKLLPPKRLGGLCDEEAGLCVLHGGRGERRCPVIGPDCTRGQEKRCQENRNMVLHINLPDR